MALHVLKPADVMKKLPPGRYSDGGGLYLHVRSATARSWIMLLSVGGKTREFSVGAAVGPGKLGLSIDEARRKAEDTRRLRTSGELITSREPPPLTAEVRTFEQVATEWIEIKFKKEVTAKTARDVESTLNRHAAPLSRMDVRTITKAHVVAVLQPLWQTKHRTASDLQIKLRTVFGYARAKDYVAADAPNPADWSVLEHILPGVTTFVKNHESVPYQILPGVMRTIRGKNRVASRALDLATLTAVRPTECRGARVQEIDFEKAIWTIPVDRMKIKIVLDKHGKPQKAPDHTVPLSRQAMALLRSVIPDNAQPGDLIFEGEKAGQMIGHNAMTHTLQRITPGTAHGMRSSFKTWCAEQTDFARELSEMQLAHVVKTESEAAYDRSDYCEKRRPMMQVWATYLDTVS